MQIKKILILICLFLAQFSCNAISFWGYKQEKKAETENFPLPFLSNIELRKKIITELETYLEDVKKKTDNTVKECADTIIRIHLDASKIQTQGKTATYKQIEYLNRKLSNLSTRKQNLINIQDTCKQIVDIITKKIALQKEIINYLQSPKTQFKPIYTWKEFQDTQIKISEQIAQTEAEKNRRETIKKQLIAEKETLLSLQKQLDAKEKERDKIIGQANHSKSESKTGDKDSPLSSSEIIKFESDIVDQEISLLKERIKFSNQKIEKLTEEEKFKEADLELLQLKLSDSRETLSEIEKRLLLDFKDIEDAKTELNKEVIAVAQIKGELTKKISPKKYEREKLAIELGFLQEAIRKLATETKPDIAKIQFSKSKLQKITSIITLIDKELLLFDAKKDIADIKAKMKEQQYKIIELRYRLNSEKLNIRELLVSYKNQRDLEASALKGFKEKRIEAVNSLVETQRLIETINVKLEKITTQKDHLIKQKSMYLENIIQNYEDTKRILTSESFVTQDFLAVCSDLIHQQTSILNYYDLIVADLETYKTTQSIWKRATTAISLEALETSLFEAEEFLKKLFWDTPNYLAPKTIFNYFRACDWLDFLFLLLIILLFIFCFWLCKKLLIKFINKIKLITDQQATSSKKMYLCIFYFCLNFILEHFTLLFSWIFVYLNIIIDYTPHFKGLSFIFYPYYQAMFYLTTVGIFVYITSNLLIELKVLDKKLSFLFLTEKIQDRLLFLLAIFMYSTSILLPLRYAYLIYIDTPAYLSEVLIAIYSLILIIVLMFFFTKDEILRILPTGQNSIILWIKRKTDKYFYPAFFFVMCLFIIANPHVGYLNLAWYLAFAIPSTLLLLYTLFIIHNYIRQYSLFFFMQEDEDQIKDRFEHAKTYYGIFIIGTFLFLLFITFTLIARIWGYNYTLPEVWRLLSETWVIPMGADNKLGVVQFLILGMFISSGFLISSLLDKFVLNKLFEILRSEPGTQNTISKITHYLILGVAILLGFFSIHLEQFILLIGGLLGIGLGFALKDVVADFVAGFFVLIERPIEIGNYIQVDTVEGTVHKISPRTTTIITSRNFAVFIPNKDLLAKNIVNWSHRRFAMGFEIYVRVTHESDPDFVRKVIIEILQSHSAVLKLPAVVARLEEFEENSFYFMSRAFISTQRLKESWAIASDLRIKLVKAFKENGINFAKPQRIVYVNEVTNETRVEEKKALSIKFDKE